jgi:hypothetical protein
MATARYSAHLAIDIILVLLFIILFAIGSGYRFNYLHLIFHDADIPIYFYVIVIAILVCLFIYNKFISILYGILIIAQIRRMLVSYFVDSRDSPEFVLSQLKARLDFDQTKSPLAKQVILDIYGKYFTSTTGILPTLKEIDAASAQFSAVATAIPTTSMY